MKKLIAVFGATMLLLFGCATHQPPTIKVNPTPVNVAIEIDDVEELTSLKTNGFTGGIPEMSPLSWVTDGVGYTKIFSGISVSDLTRAWQDWTLLESIDVTDVTVLINSPGGDAFQGLALAGMVHHFRQDRGFKFRMSGSGIIASAAVPIFAAGDYRVALSSTIFMLHEAAIWKWPGRETASDIKSQNIMMERLSDEYTGLLEKGTGTPAKKWYELMRLTTWLSCDEAKDLNLVDECL